MATSEKEIHEMMKKLENLKTTAIQNATTRQNLAARQTEMMNNLHGMGFSAVDPKVMMQELQESAQKTVEEIRGLIPDV